jgi:hypothetical protein
MTKLEVIYDVKEKLQISTDDDIMTDEYIGHLVDVKRMVLIKQTFSTVTKAIPVACLSEICLDLEIVDAITGSPMFGHILRTKQIIPTVMNISGREDLITVRSIDNLSTGFNAISMERFPFLGHNKYLNNQIYTAINSDGRIYFYSKRDKFKLMSKVIARGVFESPTKANEMSCLSSCNDMDNEYPIEGYMIDDIVSLIRKDLVVTLQTPNDDKNDSTDDRKEK